MAVCNSQNNGKSSEWSTVPQELRDLKQWHNWRDVNGVKIPFQVNGSKAKSNDPTTWTDFDTANAFGYLAFEITDPYVGVDLDNCLDKDGSLRQWAWEIIARFDGLAYAEISPSGKGIKFLTRGKKREGARCVHKIDQSSKQQIECYDHSRFWTVTGDVYNHQLEIGDGQEAVDWICGKYLSTTVQPVVTSSQKITTGSSLENRASAYVNSVPAAGPGDRNNTAFRLAGHLYSIVGDFGERLSQGQVIDFVRHWNNQNFEPLPDEELVKAVQSSKSNGTPRHDKRPQASEYRGDKDQSFIESITKNVFRKLEPISFSELRRENPERRKVLIEGILRQGETWNLIAAAKVGKSWLLYGLIIAVCMGYYWLGKFRCERKRVLLIDNELHPEELSFRIGKVAEKMHIDEEELSQYLDVICLRGNILDIVEIGRQIISNIEKNHYGLICLDAKYRAVAGGENDNDDQRDFYNLIDNYAMQSGAAWVLVHHSSKGNQSQKSVTDVGAGGGSQSRAADVHMVFREHEEEACIVIDAAMRSHKPVDPVVAKFDFPLWKVQEGLSPEDLKAPQGRGEAAQDKKDRETTEDIRRILGETDEPLSITAIKKQSIFGRDRIERGINLLANSDELNAIEKEHANGQPYSIYSLNRGSPTDCF